jgi:MraZ protein
MWWVKVLNYVTKGQDMDENSVMLENEIKGQGIFVGEFVHSLDPKKRLTIPSEWRVQVGTPKSLYVLRDVTDKCLCVFPTIELQRRIERIRHHSIADAKARQFTRILGSKSDLVAWDSQGRIRIKDELLDFAGLIDQVVMVGAFHSFELWNPDNWNKVSSIDSGTIHEAAQYVGF